MTRTDSDPMGDAGDAAIDAIETTLAAGVQALERMPLVRRRLTAARRDWEIACVDDQKALIDAADGLATFPFGLMLWESAIALADHLAECPTALSGRPTLELGCGVGLAGLAARSIGAHVVQTDHSAEALALARRNADAHGLADIRLALGDWREWPHLGRFETVIGADILYDEEVFGAVLRVLDRSLMPRGRIVLSDPGRPATPRFLERLAAVADIATTTARAVPALAPTSAGQVVVVSVIEARWRGR
ncbi:MAG: methyltransferase domain-containing protein [Hyphomicrobiaceae bacterium]|nr:methyltransferase domain-containing protein [Hyphomicrobiaceae bacterium]